MSDNFSNPLALFIDDRMAELQINDEELCLRMGFKKIDKGLMYLENIKAGDLKRVEHLKTQLAKALEVDKEVVSQAIEEYISADIAKDKADYAKAFKPHAIVLCERTIPQPIFIAALGGFAKHRRIDFELGSSPTSYVKQVQAVLPDKIPSFGNTLGFVINYALDYAVRFDLSGNPSEVLDDAVRLGTASVSIKGRPITDTLGIHKKPI